MNLFIVPASERDFQMILLNGREVLAWFHTTYYRVSRKGHILISTTTKLRNLSLAKMSL
jgi:hypothetical protein